MAHALADETLDIILQHVLDVSDADFFDVSGMESSPFGRRQYSNSTVLLVCKRWMRVATPLLYKTVILRSTAQAQALSKALKEDPGFGRFLQRLRLESGFGVALGKIMLTAAPHLRDLHISLDLRSQDNVKPMCEAFAAINPSRLALSVPRRLTKTAIATRSALQAAAPTWTNLTTVVVRDERVSLVENALTALPALRTLYLKGTIFLYSAQFIGVIKRWPSCKIHVDYKAIVDKASIEDAVSKYADQLIIYREEARANNSVVLHATNRGRPMRNAPFNVQVKIWALVFQHILSKSEEFYTCGYDTYMHSATGQPLAPTITSQGAIRYLLVCKLFHAVCLPVTLRHLAILNDEKVASVLALIKTRPQLALRVESLSTSRYTAVINFSTLISRLPRVRSLRCCIDISDNGDFETCAVGVNLVELDIVYSMAAANPPSHMFLIFPALRRLQISFDTTNSPTQTLLTLNLPQLEELFLGYSCPAWVISCFAQSHLPRLRVLTILREKAAVIEDFLIAHGPGIQDIATRTEQLGLVLRYSANVQTVILAFSHVKIPSPDTLTRDQPHVALQRIVFPGVLPYGYDSASRQDLKRLSDAGTPFFAAIQPDMFPALREIILKRTSWPVHPRHIAASPIVRWADSLKAKGITLLDKSGTAWRSRLKHGRAG